MYVKDILDLARLRLDDVVKDAKGNYLWSDTELLVYHNEAEHELARKSRCLYDASTAVICQYDVFPNVPTLSIDKRIVEINVAYFSTFYRRLFIKPAKYFDSYMGSNWRGTQGQPAYIIPNYEPHKIRFYPYYPTTYKSVVYTITGVSNISLALTGIGTGTISYATGGLLTLFPSGTHLSVSGTTNNNVTLVSAGGTETLLNVTGTVVTEASTSAVLSKQIDTLNLEVARLPLINVAIEDIATAIPEVDEDYHLSLIDGILSMAYLKRDSETYNIGESSKYRARWDSFIEDVKESQIIIGEEDTVFAPHYGSL